jgi:hypothetical protein
MSRTVWREEAEGKAYVPLQCGRVEREERIKKR